MITFIRIEGDENYHDTDVNVDAIVAIVDRKKNGSKVLLTSGVSIPTKERAEHLKIRIERLR